MWQDNFADRDCAMGQPQPGQLMWAPLALEAELA